MTDQPDNTDDQNTDQPVWDDSLPAPERRRRIADVVMGSLEKTTQQELADQFGVTQPTIHADMQSDEYAQAGLQQVRFVMKAILFPRALARVAKSIIYQGDDEKKNAKADADAKWLLEKFAQIIIDADDRPPDEQTFENLKLILTGNGQVADLEAKIAVLEKENSRLTKMVVPNLEKHIKGKDNGER
jgi:hypothetical protein